MPRVGEFCAANISRLLLGIFIVTVVVLGLGIWAFYSPGHGASIETPAKTQPHE